MNWFTRRPDLVTAIGDRAWAPTSSVMPPLYSQNTIIVEDGDVVEINEHSDGNQEEVQIFR